MSAVTGNVTSYAALQKDRPRLRLVGSEEDRIEPPTAAERQAMRAGNASWKFELFETVAADPLLDGVCLQVIVAYSFFCGEKGGASYLSENDLRARTGRSQPRVLRAAKRKLIELGYLVPYDKTAARIQVYRLENPRRDAVADHRVAAAARMKEEDAAQRAMDRRKRSKVGVRSAPHEGSKWGSDQYPTWGSDQHPNTVEHSVEEKKNTTGENYLPDAGGGFRPEDIR